MQAPSLPPVLEGLCDVSGRTRSSVAADAGLSPASLGNYLSGIRRPSIQKLLSILRALDASARQRRQVWLAAGMEPSDLAVEYSPEELDRLEDIGRRWAGIDSKTLVPMYGGISAEARRFFASSSDDVAFLLQLIRAPR